MRNELREMFRSEANIHSDVPAGPQECRHLSRCQAIAAVDPVLNKAQQLVDTDMPNAQQCRHLSLANTRQVDG